MTNLITELILNFKETLKNNYYSKTSEKDEFLRWLEANTSYVDGVCKIHNQHINTETEQEDSGTGDVRLKNYVKSWSRSRYDKQEYWNTLMDDRSSYLNGKFCFDEVNDKYKKQTVTGFCEYELYFNGKHYYRIEITASPGVAGQEFSFNPVYTVYRTNTVSSGSYSVLVTSDNVIRESLTLTAESFVDNNDVVYSGGSVIVNPQQP